MVDGLLDWEGHPMYALVGVELLFDLCGRLVWGEKALRRHRWALSRAVWWANSPFLLRLSPK